MGCCMWWCALQASMVHAAEVTAGMPFVLKISLQSHSALLQTLDVVLRDSTGFVTSGEPCRLVSCLYKSMRGHAFTWHLCCTLPGLFCNVPAHYLQTGIYLAANILSIGGCILGTKCKALQRWP